MNRINEADAIRIFRRDLGRYINGGCLSRADKVASLLIPSSPFLYNAGSLVNAYGALTLPAVIPVNGETVEVDTYQGTNRRVFDMMQFLNRYLRDHLAGAYVHGSLGTYDEIAYSDFDGLVILSDAAFEAASALKWAGRKLHEARRIMLEYDPLQHHGWFVLTERDLLRYPADYFPPALFHRAKSLFPDKGRELTIYLQMDSNDIARSFYSLADAVAARVSHGKHPTNMYELKSLLSEIMLLPALYVQARDGVGVYKKESFEQARRDFPDGQWDIMDKISQIRRDWHYEIGAYPRRLLTIPHAMARKWILRAVCPAIPEHFAKQLTGDFYRQVAVLIRRMSENLNRPVSGT